jgi:hypothetical protein
MNMRWAFLHAEAVAYAVTIETHVSAAHASGAKTLTASPPI